MKLNQEAAIPLYQQLKDELKQEIESKKLVIGQKISTEQELSKQYKISRITVRKAISELEAEGYLIKNQGKGTFVTRPKIERKIEYLLSFSEACKMNGMTPSSFVTTKEVLSPTKEQYKALDLSPNDKVLYIQRVRCADSQPLMCENNYYSYSKFSFLLDEKLDTSLYQLLNEKYGIHISRSIDSYLEVTRANSSMSKLLNVPNREPLFYMYTKILDTKNQIVHIGRQYMVGDRFRFDIADVDEMK